MPVTINGEKKSALAMVEEMNEIAGRNGVGRIDMVENRFVGMKSRGVYEAPGMTALYAAHQAIEQLTLDRDMLHLRDRLAPEVAEMVYYGFWYVPKMDALMAFIREARGAGHRRSDARALQGQHLGRAAAPAPTASTTQRSPAWKAAAATTKPTRKASCESKGCRAGC